MKRNKFSLSHYNLFSADMGELLPIGLWEVLPGDTFQHNTSALVRVSPLLTPVMHPVSIRIHHWFVPHRLIWEDFENFITGGPDGMDASVFPQITLSYTGPTPGTGSGRVGGLADYLGSMPGTNGAVVSALPFRAYAKIYNEFYRDQDLQTELTIDESSGPDTTTNTDLQNCCWEKDYFTSARPWTQKGPQVNIPLQGTADVKGIGKINATFGNAGPLGVRETGGTTPNYTNFAGINSTVPNDTWTIKQRAATGFPDITAALDSGSISVNDLRLAMALQRWEEARAQFGSRYTEYLRYYGIKSSDARLQRPEYLGGGKQTIQFSEVLQTAPEDGEDSIGVGNLKGHGIGAVRSNRYRRFFEEHGYVMTLMSVRPKTIYVQGTPRTWHKTTKEDFWQKELQHIGQQEVFQREIFAKTPTPTALFGYQDRYDEYRRAESRVSSEFRTSQLDMWHMARIFADSPSPEPTLNADFVKCVPTKRINAVQTNDVLWVMANHHVVARRMVAATGKSFIY